MPLTAAQKKLPKKLQDAIMAKHKKTHKMPDGKVMSGAKHSKASKPMKKQTKKDRLSESEGKTKAMKKKKQSVSSRLDEAEGKKKAKRETKKIRDRKTY
tara:strand:+ start:363 stop:659 length:297 start_codon:yes stop_codon:yes gene_type:complete